MRPYVVWSKRIFGSVQKQGSEAKRFLIKLSYQISMKLTDIKHTVCDQHHILWVLSRRYVLTDNDPMIIILWFKATGVHLDDCILFIYCMQQRENKYSKSLYHWKITKHDNRLANLVCLPNPRKLISTTCAITMSGDWCPMQTPDVMYNESLIYLIRCRNHFLANA